MIYLQLLSPYVAPKRLMCALLLFFSWGWLTSSAKATTPQAKKTGTGTQHRPLTQAAVQKLWTAGDDRLLSNEIRLRGLAFIPSGYWLDVELPKLTGVAAPLVPGGTAALRHLIPTPPDVDAVAQAAPALLASLKTAAQARSDAAMQPLIDTSLMANKAVIYDIFDPSNFRASSLGKPSDDGHGDMSLPFFELTASNVEKLYYLLVGRSKSNLVILDVITGPSVAELYLHDQETLAKTKLETMFRALDDGDEAGVKQLCTPGLYQAIQDWGGVKHPGDRLSQGHQFSQVTAVTSVLLDQKSIRVVTKVSYPMTAGNDLTFFIDFERVGNDLKVVRLRDNENKVIVYDPKIDNYLNERYGLPDGPVPDPSDVAMTDQVPFLNSEALRNKAMRVLQYHDRQQMSEIANLLVKQNPTSGEGYGIRAALDLMLRRFEDADKDGLHALDSNGTAYFIVERNSFTSTTPFSTVVLGISKSKIEYLPAPGSGSAETIDLHSIQKVAFEKGKGFGSFVKLSEARPFVKLEFKGSDGKTKGYNFADFGTMCPTNTGQPQANDLISVPGDIVCGSTSPTGTVAGAQGIPLLTPQTWHEDLTVVAQLINAARGSSGK